MRGSAQVQPGRAVWDEDKANEEIDDDGRKPALQDVIAGDDLAAMLTGMRTGESAELRCENSTFELVRDR